MRIRKNDIGLMIFFSNRSIFILSKVRVSTTGYENSYFQQFKTKVWSENNVYFFYAVGHIAKVYFFGGHSSILTTQEPEL